MNSIEIDFIYALIGVALFIFRNPQKKFLYLIASFVVGLFVSQLVYLYVPGVGHFIWTISAIGLIILYFFRFKEKENTRTIDFLKIPAIILLVIYPITFNSLVRLPEMVWIISQPLTFWLPAFIYVYDRWILKPEIMKKKFVIVLVAQSVLILLMAMYAFVQRAEAEAQHRYAEKAVREANENLKKYLEQQEHNHQEDHE